MFTPIQSQAILKSIQNIIIADNHIAIEEAIFWGKIKQQLGLSDKEFKEAIVMPQELMVSIIKHLSYSQKEKVKEFWFLTAAIDNHIDWKEMGVISLMAKDCEINL